MPWLISVFASMVRLMTFRSFLNLVATKQIKNDLKLQVFGHAKLNKQKKRKRNLSMYEKQNHLS
jgi:hypothetical protein